MNNISIFGAGGHAKVVLEIIQLNKLNLHNVYDSDVNKKIILGYEITHETKNMDSNTLVAIGNNFTRKCIVDKYDLSSDSIIHPSANFSKYVNFGKGNVVMAGVSVNVDTVIGNHCILNTNCSLDHDCLIQDFVHISPNAALAGNVNIGKGTHVGIGACIIQGVQVGNNCIIGAGAVIIKNVPDNSIVVGNPGKIIKRI